MLRVTADQLVELSRLTVACSMWMQPDGTGYDEMLWIAGIDRILGEDIRDALLRAAPVNVEVFR